MGIIWLSFIMNGYDRKIIEKDIKRIYKEEESEK